MLRIHLRELASVDYFDRNEKKQLGEESFPNLFVCSGVRALCLVCGGGRALCLFIRFFLLMIVFGFLLCFGNFLVNKFENSVWGFCWAFLEEKTKFRLKNV